MTTPHLPVEIHIIISSHLAREDLRSYRSTSKQFADLGAQYLFKELTFHASYASLERIKNIGAREHLSQYTQKIIWDTACLDLDAKDSNEWLEQIRGLRQRGLSALWMAWHEQLLDHAAVEECMQKFLSQQYDEQVSLVAEEQEVQGVLLTDLNKLLGPFPKLRSIVLEKKRYNCDDATADDLELDSATILKRGILHQHRCAPFKPSTDMYPLITALEAAQPSIYNVEVRSLNFGMFSQQTYTQHLQHISAPHITRLHLRFALLDHRSESFDTSLNIMNCRHVLQQGHLGAFLNKFKNLQALGLDFEARSSGNGRAGVNLQDVFAAKQANVWMNLHELTILHAEAPASSIAALLSSHAASLRSLSLGDICFDPPASWVTLLTELQPVLSLEKSILSHFLFDARIENFLRGRSAMLGWDLGGGELGSRLGKFMVGGGVCPLREERKITRVVGRSEGERTEDWVGGRMSGIGS